MGNPLRIAIDARLIDGANTGDRTYWRGLLGALSADRPDWTFLALSRVPVDPAARIPGENIEWIAIPGSGDRLWSMVALPRAMRQLRPDVLHVQYTAPWGCKCPIISTYHDISFRLHPEWFRRRDSLLLRMGAAATLRRISAVLTVSESSRADIIAAYGVAPKRVIATPLAASTRFTPRRVPGGCCPVPDGVGPYILSVGLMQPRKNLATLVRAFGIARREGMNLSLVIAGKAGWGVTPEALLLEASWAGGEDAANAVHFTGWVDDAVLADLYRECTFFAYPSLYEGFGLPVLEAMACGAPVLTSDIAVFRETTAGHAVLADPLNAFSIAHFMKRLGSDDALRARLSLAGRENALRYSWSKTAAETARVYQAASVGPHCSKI